MKRDILRFHYPISSHGDKFFNFRMFSKESPIHFFLLQNKYSNWIHAKVTARNGDWNKLKCVSCLHWTFQDLKWEMRNSNWMKTCNQKLLFEALEPDLLCAMRKFFFYELQCYWYCLHAWMLACYSYILYDLWMNTSENNWLSKHYRPKAAEHHLY